MIAGVIFKQYAVGLQLTIMFAINESSNYFLINKNNCIVYKPAENYNKINPTLGQGGNYILHVASDHFSKTQTYLFTNTCDTEKQQIISFQKLKSECFP